MARSLLEKIGIGEEAVFFILIFGGIPLLIAIPAMLASNQDNQKEIRMAEIEANKAIAEANAAKVTPWIGIDEVRELQADSLVLNQDEEKGVYLLVAVTGADIQSFYVKNSDVESVSAHISEQDN